MIERTYVSRAHFLAPVHSLTALYETPATMAARSEAGIVRCLQLSARALAAVDELPDQIEETVSELARTLGAHADCSATGTGVFLTIAIGDRLWTEIIRTRPTAPDFARAVALHRLLGKIREGEIPPDEGARRLETLIDWPTPSSTLRTILASAVLSASSALLLRAEWPELLIAVGLGAVVGLVLSVTSGRSHLEPLAPVVLAALASAIAFRADSLGFNEVRPAPLIIAGLVVLLPGWRLTVAMTELSQGHWNAGAGRFMAAITTLLLLIVGIAVGQQAVQSSDSMGMARFGNVPTWVRIISPVLAGLAMTQLFRARWRDGGMIALMCVLTSLSSWVARVQLGSTAGAFVGAFTAMALGALIARHRDLPYPVLQLPATVLLVPGSVGLMSMGSLVANNVSTAVQTGFQMLFVALTLALGAMTAEVALRPIMLRPVRRRVHAS